MCPTSPKDRSVELEEVEQWVGRFNDLKSAFRREEEAARREFENQIRVFKQQFESDVQNRKQEYAAALHTHLRNLPYNLDTSEPPKTRSNPSHRATQMPNDAADEISERQSIDVLSPPTRRGSMTSSVRQATSSKRQRSQSCAGAERNHQASGDTPPKRLKGEETITFEEVYKGFDGHPRYMIFPFPKDADKWYILRCKEHDMDFGLKPVLSASRHLCNPDHATKSRGIEVVISLFGLRVLDCDKGKAEKNNAAGGPQKREDFGTKS
ncbi:uncharacterized protein ColSpa_08687 [Colletotrichum spaethianum]|uniref:Uncharacterized protein n=1 Tax=Colletotrichum spaethianum TaxID=700344 RepID=A0AA37PAA5_9PEZI|nr:uncharacterized protein ColSpa_08687 [Colletotrichum spaethianum]GKT48506.1 hypothetical protein ColSpa_08687 [Colletotrichum spaethianum]